MKKVLSFLLLFIIVLFNPVVYAEKPSQNNQYNSYDYVIDSYDINVVVNENNRFDITETIVTYFNVPKHGIYRKIPLVNKINRLDGTSSTNHAQVKNITVNNEYDTTRTYDNYEIKIGSADKTVTGEQKYIIKYTYNIGKDPMDAYDELYFNIIGNEWDTVIGNVTFSITMPKEFDSSKLGFSSGVVGSTDSSKVKYNVDGNRITGSYDGILNVGEGITVRCELPEGYFVGASLDVDVFSYVFFFLPPILLIISIFLWYKYGRDDKVIETVEFYPPEGMNSLDAGLLYKGSVDNKDVTSLLIYLANKGYLKISETEEKSFFSKKKSFKITRLKLYDGNNDEEKMFMKGLFKRKIKPSFGKSKEESDVDLIEVTASDLYDNFYITMGSIIASKNNKHNKYRIFEKSSMRKSIIVILMMLLSYVAITVPLFYSFGEMELLIVALLFPIVGLIVCFTIFRENAALPVKILFILCFGGLFVCMPWCLIVLPLLFIDKIYIYGSIIGFICVIGMGICYSYLPKRTPYGNEMLGKLRGFKRFLETAEKDRLEAMVMQDPEYFYNILPYTYVLGVSDKWIKKFETISLKAPDWYDGYDNFSTVAFADFIDNTMSSAQYSMSSSPSSDGGSSGGGSSGGGSGGGGGGSW